MCKATVVGAGLSVILTDAMPCVVVAASIFSSSNMRLNHWYIIGELLIHVECVQVWSKLFYNRELS